MVPVIYEKLLVDCTIPLQGQGFEYRLKGCVYYGSNHFTALFLDNTHTLWHHDGMHGCKAKVVATDHRSGEFPSSFGERQQALAIYKHRDLPSMYPACCKYQHTNTHDTNLQWQIPSPYPRRSFPTTSTILCISGRIARQVSAEAITAFLKCCPPLKPFCKTLPPRWENWPPYGVCRYCSLSPSRLSNFFLDHC